MASSCSSESWVTGLYLLQGNTVYSWPGFQQRCALEQLPGCRAKWQIFSPQALLPFAEVQPAAVCEPSVGWLTCPSQVLTSLLWWRHFCSGILHLPSLSAREYSGTLGSLWGKEHRCGRSARQCPEAHTLVGFCLHSPISSGALPPGL